MERKEENKLKYKFVLSLILFFISLLLFLFVLMQIVNSLVVLEKKEIPATFVVGDHYGIAVDKENLTFGMVVPGASTKKEIIVENTYNFPVVARIIPEGDMKKFVQKEDVIISKKNITTLVIRAYAPSEISMGNYTGSIIIILKKQIWEYST